MIGRPACEQGYESQCQGETEAEMQERWRAEDAAERSHRYSYVRKAIEALRASRSRGDDPTWVEGCVLYVRAEFKRRNYSAYHSAMSLLAQTIRISKANNAAEWASVKRLVEEGK